MHQFSGMCLGLSDRYGTAEFGHKTWNLKKRLQSQRAVLQSQLLALGENSPKCSVVRIEWQTDIGKQEVAQLCPRRWRC